VPIASATVDAVARDGLGIDDLLPEQRHAMVAAAEGRDALVVMPTGAGKSAIYQVAGELRDGPTIVVSPLLALQHDQVRAIDDSSLSQAAALNSLQGRAESERVVGEFVEGRIEFLFLAPEQLRRRELVEVLARGAPSLFVVDEAHCISAWGHDFRPDYLALGEARRALGRPPVLALTASAAPPVRREIVERLALDDPLVVVGSFDRPELDLSVRRFVDAATKIGALAEDATEWRGAAIVYAATRRGAQEASRALQARGIAAEHYHGGLARRERARIHGAFVEGEVPVVVATNAFGMGIDAPHVRTVAHLDVPGSLDAYYQEIGRAGRDREEATAVLYFRPEDLGVQRFFVGGTLDEHTLAATLAVCDTTAAPVDAISRRAEVSRGKARRALDQLAAVGAVAHGPRGWRILPDGAEGAIEAAVHGAEVRRRTEQSRVDMMRAYAETTACRRVLLLGYYGAEFQPPCGRCDNCRDRDTRSDTSAGPFAVGQPVQHAEWGPGTVMTTNEDTLVVWFGEVGYRTLLTELVVEHELLTLSNT
jgi:ATP-dependent DNA helicase RecQ